MAITVLYDALKANIIDEDKLYLINEFDKVLGLDLLKEDEIVDEIPQEVKDMAQIRWQAKLDKNCAVADEMRNKITSLGYQILDSKEGYDIKKV